jgi:hypothetical protein
MATSTHSWNRICDRQPSLRSTLSVDQELRMWKKICHAIFNRENFLALLLALILIALVIFTADTSPTWIYQGF